MKKLGFLIVTFLFWSATAATAQDVRYDYDKDKDFSKFKTYKWVEVKAPDQVDPLTAKQIVAAVDAELAKKGLEKTDSNDAQLYIDYQTAVGTEKQYTAYNTGWNSGPGWGPGWYGGGMTSSTTYGSTSTVYVGALDLSMYDSAQHELVWRGSVSRTLDPKSNPEKKQKNIQKSVAKLLKNFPPEPKK